MRVQGQTGPESAVPDYGFNGDNATQAGFISAGVVGVPAAALRSGLIFGQRRGPVKQKARRR
jgi:hypothetical protein